MDKQMQAAGPLSEQEVIEWLKKKPRTYGWDVLMMYDRSQANLLLLQQYINRYAKEESFFEPINGRIVIEDGQHWEYMYDTVLDKPRLSFEKSTPGSSLATLTMHIVGGAHMTVKQPENGAKRVSRVDWYDPLQGPKVIATLDLEDADGNVSVDGRVMLNLAAGLDIRLTIGTTNAIQKKGGSFFQDIFDNWEDGKKIIVLNTIVRRGDSEFLEPDKFRIRVMPAPGAALRNSPTYGSGAVMAFISSVGSEVGGMPDVDAEWEYLIPEGYSTAMLVGNRYLMSKLMASGIRAVAPEAEVEVIVGDEPSDPVGSIRALCGLKDAGSHWLNFHGNFSLVFVEAVVPLATSATYGDASFVMKMEDSAVAVDWVASSRAGSYATKLWQQSPDGESYVDIDWSLHFDLIAGLGGDGSISFNSADWSLRTTCKIHPRGQLHPNHEEWWEFLLAGLEPVGRHEMAEAFAAVSFADGLLSLDVFRAGSLLFEGDRNVRSRSVHMPMDLVIFGDLAPEQTAFAIDPLEEVIGVGSSIQLVCVPAQEDATWRVEMVPGFEGELGSITAEGKYTAPSGLPEGSAYTTVRVTASSGEYTSSALIRVVARSVVVNPLVAQASKTGGNIHLSGGAIDRGSLNWSIKSVTGATLTDVPPDHGAEFDEGDRFYVPGTISTDGIYSIDEITVTNPRTGDKHTSYMLMVEEPTNATLVMREDAGLPPDQIQFEMNLGYDPLQDVTWSVVAGGGAIDSNGVYTVDHDSPYRFTVITAYLFAPGFGKFHNYVILPLPLIDLEDIKRALS